MIRAWLVSAALATSAFVFAISANAAPPRDAAAVDRPDAEISSPKRDIELGIGGRMMFLPDAGFGPYANNDLLGQVAFTGAFELLKLGRFSVAIAAEWDLGGRSATARQEVSSILMNRFSAGLEARYALASRLTGFVRVAPVAIALHATIEDAMLSDRPLEANEWTWGVDATAGGRLLLAGHTRSKVRLWLLAEAGYAFAGVTHMRFAPSEELDDPRSFAQVALPDLRPSGAIARIGLVLGF